MSESPPTGSPNAPALVSLSAHREAIISRLTERFAVGELEMGEFESRLDAAHQATSLATLDELVSDLARPEPQQSDTQAMMPRPAPLPAHTRPQRKRLLAIMGGVERTGAWTMPAEMRAFACMGGIKLDFREARLAAGENRLHAVACMGGIEIIVPPHVAVEADGIAIMGGFEDVHRRTEGDDADTPVLVISGWALMGGVEVKTRLPGENSWQAWRRERGERRERKRLRRAHRKARGRLGDGT
ncbi:DUF1707 SHOCT-like domain-containing protein [Haliangium ochraceum]|uniref:Uncharacterized protein n=1 Tax=Haliangium ochraceum (strain DSM 14365 / JCM 11303 / SMP-2) TaxID=502025 RepID=D0LXI0_HALO1|nr:DUF1707 domain-containing protein [Haliangium ochraceum]ACY17735.1 protein of unknown function DUF1707 [Haliangium ochraceum DSM 14365]